MGRVFLTTGMARTCLAAVRSLGRAGLEVTVGEETRFPLAAFSRYCSRSLLYASPESRPDAFMKWVFGHLKRERYDVAMPVDQHSFFLFSRNVEELGRLCKVPVAGFQVFQRAYDKAKTFRAAIDAGVPCPKTYFPSTSSEVADLALKADFPLVIKPRIGSGSRSVSYVRDKGELLACWERLHSFQPRPLIQEFIPPGGEALGVSLLFNRDSEPRAVFAHRRLREYPLSGGPSTLRESVSRPEAASLAIKLLKSINWYGVAMVEFKVDPRDNVAKLMEINPKFWGSLGLAIASGVDFPALLYRLATEGDVSPVSDYRLGVRTRFLAGDILHFLANPDRLALIPEFFRPSPSTRGDIWDGDDPVPALGLSLAFLLRGWRPGFLRHVLLRSRPGQGAKCQQDGEPFAVEGGERR